MYLNKLVSSKLRIKYSSYSSVHWLLEGVSGKYPEVQEGSCCIGTPGEVVVHRLWMVACSSSEFAG